MTDPYNLEEKIQSSFQNGGYAASLPIAITDWRLPTGLHLAAANTGIVGIGAMELGTNDLMGLVWEATATTTDIATAFITIPDEYDPREDKCELVVRAAKLGAGTDNADLALTCDAKWFGAGDTAGGKLAAALSETLGAKVTSTEHDDFEEFTFTLSGNGFKPGGLVELSLSVNEAVGTGLSLNVFGTRLRYLRSASLNNRDDRQIA